MNRTFLGDALDHWKGSLISQLQDGDLVQNLMVVPMVTDSQPWREDEVAAYARLLHVDQGRVLGMQAGLGELKLRRTEYFAGIPTAGDIFLDPDTGIRTGRVRRPEKYVTLEEVGRLLSLSPERFVLVYQHSARGGMSKRVDEVTEALHKGSRCAWTSYESTTAAMLFLSLDREGPRRVAEYFRKALGPNARNRIRQGRHRPADR